MGKHRLIGGDTTVFDDVKKLMQNDIAAMIFTDPPYNVNYGSTLKDSINYHAGSLGGRKIMNDNLGDGFAQFLKDSLSNLMMFSQGAVYVCMSSSELHTLYKAFIEAGGKWSTFIEIIALAKVKEDSASFIRYSWPITGLHLSLK